MKRGRVGSYVSANGDGSISFTSHKSVDSEAIHLFVMLFQGFEVSGSDIVRSSFMDGLYQMGAHLCIGHSASNIQRDKGLIYPDSVVVSSAIPPDNSEVLHAKSVGIPV